MLAFSADWELRALEAGRRIRAATSRLEFWRHPDLMAQFPFAHAVEMTHRLREGVLEIETRLENRSAEPMPVSLGYHPFFRLPGSPRSAWRVTIPAREEMLVSEDFLPTGRIAPLARSGTAALAEIPAASILSFLARARRTAARNSGWKRGRSASRSARPPVWLECLLRPAGGGFRLL